MLKNSHALLTIEGLPKMNKREVKKIIKWLNNVANELEVEDNKVFSNPCRFRLMK